MATSFRPTAPTLLFLNYLFLNLNYVFLNRMGGWIDTSNMVSTDCCAHYY